MTVLEQAISLHQNGDLQKAELLYSEALSASLDDCRINFLYGTIEFQLGKSEAALIHLTKSINLKKDYFQAYNNLGLVYQALGNTGNAIHYFSEALRISPKYIDASINLGTALQTAGKHDEAIRVFQKMIFDNPDNIEARYNLGLCLVAKKEFRMAAECFSKALAISPDQPQLLNARGVCRQELKMTEAAKRDYLQAASLNLYDENSRYNAASIYFTEKKYREAEELLRETLLINENYTDAHKKIAEIYIDEKQNTKALHHLLIARSQSPSDSSLLKQMADVYFDEKEYFNSIEALEESCRLNPHDIVVLNNLGLNYKALGKTEKAILFFDKALTESPDSAEVLNNLGTMYEFTGDTGKARKYLERAVEVKPDYAEALFSLGNTYLNEADYTTSTGFYHQAIAINPKFSKVYNNLGVAYQQTDKLETSAHWLNIGLSLDPESADMYNNLGNTLRSLNQIDDSLAAFKKALEINPDFPEAHKNYGITLLLNGDFEKGWEHFEWRWKVDLKERVYTKPRWTGELVSGKRLFVYFEQGFGDTVQFARLLKIPVDAGMKVYFEPQKELVEILKRLPFDVEILEPNSSVSVNQDFDFHIPLMSVPYALKLNDGVGTVSTPYLLADNDIIEKWKQIIDVEKYSSKLKIGLVWAGNKSHKNNRNRSIILKDFEQLFENNNIQYFSLQVGESLSEISNYADKIVNLGEKIANFEDTLAIISHMDLIITVDTVAGHLSGAQNKLARILINYSCDWRWLLGTENSKWYQSVTLFRQEAKETWKQTIARLAEEIKTMTQTNTKQFKNIIKQ